MDDAAEAGPEGDGVMTWMRTAMAGPRWRSKRAHGRVWGRPLPSSGTLRTINKKKPQNEYSFFDESFFESLANKETQLPIFT